MSNTSIRIRGLSCACGLTLVLLAGDASALFIVNLPWLRPAASGQSTELYMNLTSTDGATLVAVRTGDAAQVVIHGGGKGARVVPQLPLPAKTLVALAPGKDHIKLVKLARTFKVGDRLALTLIIEGADGVRQEIPLVVEVRNRSVLDDERRAHGHAH
jgi:copper(I)-binding protein